MASASPSDPAAGPDEVAAAVLRLVEARPPTLGGGRLVCVDGPGGSGKTTLAAALAALVPGTTVVHMDDLYAGWSGLAEGAAQLGPLLRGLAAGRTGTYRRFDWHADDWAGTVEVEPRPLLVVEGVGSGAGAVADLVTVLVWVSAPDDLRLARGIERDGEHLREQWLTWMRTERAVLARERTAARADVVVDGTGARPPRLPPGEAPRARGGTSDGGAAGELAP